MADTLEKQISDLEPILAHLPEDLDARLAGADARAGARFDRLNIQLQALKTEVQRGQTATATQIAALDGRLTRMEAKVAAIEGSMTRIGPQVVAIGGSMTRIGPQVVAIGRSMTRMEAQVVAIDVKLDDVLSRSPPKA